MSTDSVIGDDDRLRVDNTSTYPQSAIALITFTDPDGASRQCTGWLYDESTLATAGHCLYTHDDANDVHGWNSDFRIYPGRDVGESPYGSCEWNRVWSVKGWTEDGTPSYDYGAIKLDCSIGAATGWYGMKWQAASYNGTGAFVTGYPSDKEPDYSMWWDGGTIEESLPRQLHYSMDTAGGQSGAPVSQEGCGAYCGIAVHTYGVYGGYDTNRGTRITEGAFANYASWRS